MTAESGSAPRPHKLPPSEIEAFLTESPTWTHGGAALRTTIAFAAYLDGAAFVQQVALLAEEANHHPDLVLRWGAVDVILTSHDAGGVTARDINMARKIAELAGRLS
ncbi:MAG: 4a-hydroxytetrahydrobiopterin dehydratase [Candidatus Marinimicrobia bacterium]|nr:4a-hydroxytetrahydrobiopterin dehydratase [Candidatus Neomarinimicrobiota bacterium]